MRNVFDQYHQPENRLTHALLCSLDADRRLLQDFLRFIVPEVHPVGRIHVLQQSLPGEPQDTPGADVEEQRGLPDGWIHDDHVWSLLIESKVAATPDVEQVARHLRVAVGRRFEHVSLLWLTVMPVHLRSVALTEAARSTTPGITSQPWSASQVRCAMAHRLRTGTCRHL